ncbi:DNA ligase 1-like [Littorina saxatilis]|uniref:DNA ligase 1-like n=1 Tax=Littorina saxatilis TaxID=31220 RepID=UPI0038B689AC
MQDETKLIGHCDLWADGELEAALSASRNNETLYQLAIRLHNKRLDCRVFLESTETARNAVTALRSDGVWDNCANDVMPPALSNFTKRRVKIFISRTSAAVINITPTLPGCQGETDTLFFKYRPGDPFNPFNLLRTRRSTGRRGRQPAPPEHLSARYSRRQPVSSTKKADLLDLCRLGIVPEQHHNFHHKLPMQRNTDSEQAVDSDNEIVIDDKEEVAPLFSFSRDVSLRRKKEHCAKALKKTLQTFLPSTLTILRKKRSGSSGTSKSNAFAKSLSSLAASKCNGDVKNSDSPKSSGSRTSAQSSSASTSRSSVKSTPASSSKTSLNSPHVSISKTTNVRTEVSEKSGEKKPQDKKVTEKRALEKKEEEKKETKGGGDKKKEKKDTAERKSQEVQEKGDKSKESPENRLDNKKEDTREVSRKRKEQSQETEEKKNEEKAKKKEVVGRKTDKKEEETEKKESRAKKTGKSTASKEKDQQSSDEERSSAIAEEESNAEDCEEAMDVDCVDDSFTEGQDAQDSTQEENADKSTSSPKDQTKSSPAVEESDNEEERSSNADASLTEGGNLLSSSQLSEDMTQQEENLFAKLELIQELAEEFCKESEAEKIEDNEEDAINTIDPSDDESLPEVSFGLPSSSPDVKITKTVDDEEDGTERMNDFSDISDADSTDNTKEVKKDAGTSDGSQSRERKEGKSASLHKTDASKEKGNVASDKDLDDSEDVDLSSSDLILSSGVDDEEARRVKRKRKLKRKSEFCLCLSSPVWPVLEPLSILPSLILMNNGTATHREEFTLNGRFATAASQERSLQQQQRRNVQDITGQDMPIVEDTMEYTTPGRKGPPSPVLKNEVATIHHFFRVQELLSPF